MEDSLVLRTKFSEDISDKEGEVFLKENETTLEITPMTEKSIISNKHKSIATFWFSPAIGEYDPYNPHSERTFLYPSKDPYGKGYLRMQIRNAFREEREKQSGYKTLIIEPKVNFFPLV